MPSLACRLRRAFAAPCLICATAPTTAVVCAACRRDFLPRARPRCPRCALPLPQPAPACGRCLREDPPFDATIALGDYAPPLDGVVVALKFGHRLALARALGRLLAQRARALRGSGATVTAVPLAFERQAERGFNQALEVARTVAAQLALPLAGDLLLRVRHAPPQEGLTLEQRRCNVRGAFAAGGDCSGRHVLVVDDVMTSGATLAEVARTLKAAGAARVTNLVVARTP
ncbi:MAG: ComF family protein [Burkholderiaceae bacterium]|nr:ComF family protein [Burkholderiaceae bacterium]